MFVLLKMVILTTACWFKLECHLQTEPTPPWLGRGGKACDTGGLGFDNSGDWPMGGHPTQTQVLRALP